MAPRAALKPPLVSRREDTAKTLQPSSKLSESALFFKGRYEVTLSGKQKSLLLQMADTFHYRV